MVFIERSQGPSKLDERLESFKDERGHVILTSEEAKDILLDSLLAEYRGRFNRMDISSKIEALAEIAEGTINSDKFDYTHMVETISLNRIENLGKNKFKKRKPQYFQVKNHYNQKYNNFISCRPPFN